MGEKCNETAERKAVLTASKLQERLNLMQKQSIGGADMVSSEGRTEKHKITSKASA